MDARLADGLGLWFEIFSTDAMPGRPALFLDRDGVIVEETNYLGHAEDVRMIASAAPAISWANQAGFAAIVVTNQAGIGRGYYGWDGFIAVQERIVTDLAKGHAHIDAVLACAFHEQGRGPLARTDHPWRKPNPGMILAAAQALRLDLGRSIAIGDKISDIEAAHRAGLPWGILVESGHGRDEIQKLSVASLSPMRVETARDIGDAIERIRAMPSCNFVGDRTLDGRKCRNLNPAFRF
jgi:D-glycero-D-manno-heptose 1,7-bisphosphate phosphatase